MNSTGIIIVREYLSRVRKRSFIIMTLLGPLLIGGFIFFIGWTATKGVDTKSIQIIDESGKFGEVFIDSEDAEYTYSNISLEESKEQVLSGKFDGMLYIPDLDVQNPQGVIFYALTNPSISLVNSLSRKIETEIEAIKLRESGIDKEVLDNLKADISISTINFSSSGDEKAGSSTAATVIGYIASFLIYIFIFVYGAMCMRGVVEEKTSRIIEVVISSVKPFQLMMGKVVGIAGVGLTQFVLWIILTFAVTSAGGSIVASKRMNNQKMQREQLEQMEVPRHEVTQQMEENFFSEINAAVSSINIPMTIVAFLFFFLTGYLLYGALFAAIGSAVDSDADAQQFMFPVTVPLIASIVMLGAVLNDPHGSLAFWMSMIPFSSPVVMMMRVPFGVPVWQLALSMALMIGGFIFTIWVASRIYRIGILMHGTKVNYKVLAKWFMMKN